jgi:hypothetical protein
MLLDSAAIEAGEPLIPIALIYSTDVTAVCRDSVVKDLQDLAFEEGFTECEVRNYFRGKEDVYDIIYTGPLHDQNAATL